MATVGRAKRGANSWESICERYCDSILDGKRPAGATMVGTCRRYRDDLERAGSRGYWFDRARASEMLDRYALLLRFPDGVHVGQPFCLYPWQAFALWQLFGWRREIDGMRRFRELFWSMARGNGKSPIAAATTLVLFLSDIPCEVNGQFYTVATVKDQARIVFRDCEGMAYASEDVREVIQFRKDKMYVDFEVEGVRDKSFLTILASDSNNTDGLRPNVVVRDELHAWREQHRELLEKIDTAMGKRPQPLSITLTTAGNDTCTLWIETHGFSSDVAQQIIPADYHLSVIYEADEADDPFSPTTWAKANPMLEHGIVSLAYLQEEAEKARHRPEKLNAFIRYYGKNRRVTSSEQLISAAEWDACYDPATVPAPNAACYAAADWGWVDDLSGFCLVFPTEIDGARHYIARSWGWIPTETPHHALDRDPWSTWIRTKQLLTIAGPVFSADAVYATLEECQKQWDIRSAAYDPNNAREFSGKCGELGIDTYGFPQKPAKFNEPIREFLTAVREKRFHHDGNAVLRWCVCNVVTRSDHQGYRAPSKKHSKSKIDVAVALLMAFSEALYGQFATPKYAPTPTIL